MLLNFVIIWPQLSLGYQALVALTCPSLSELMDYRGFLWRLMALTQPARENHAERQRGFMEQCS